MAFDVGSVRIGVARSDPGGILAVPLAAIPAGSIGGVDQVLDEWQPIEVYVGLPRLLSGSEGASAGMARQWAAVLAERTTIPIRLTDERLTTVQAQRGLHEAGRSTKQSREHVDSASAVVFLQDALDFEARTGQSAGELVTGGDGA